MKTTYRAFCLLCLAVTCLFSFSGLTEEFPAEIDLATSEYEAVLKIEGDNSGDQLGLSVDACDFNGDGYDDIVMCATSADRSSGTNSGAAYIVFGSAEMKSTATVRLDENGANILELIGESGGDQFGSWCGTGDFNGDGYGDIIISAMSADTDSHESAGIAYILFGYSGITSGEFVMSDYPWDILEIGGMAGGDQFGYGVTAGDMNGDGYDDAIISANNADPFGRKDAGETYLIFGSANMAVKPDFDLDGNNSGVVSVSGYGYNDDYPDRSGWRVGCGDVNGDGYKDAVIGGIFADPNALTNAGETYVIFGAGDIEDKKNIDLRERPSGTLRISGLQQHGYAGNAVDAGDLDGDGYDEILIDAYAIDFSGRENAGNLYVVKGSYDIADYGEIKLSDPQAPVITIQGERSGDHLGATIASADLNGDGIEDLITGSLNNDPDGRSNAGSAYILQGEFDIFSSDTIDLRNPPESVVSVRGRISGGRFGMRVGAGDIDGDGISDAILSNHDAAPAGKGSAGEVFILWGINSGRTPIPTRFDYTANTGNNSIVLIPADSPPLISGNPIEPGDEIGIFTPAGLCAGAGVWRGENLAITVWGDNLYEDGVTGFIDGETLRYRILDKSAGKLYDAGAVYTQGDGAYHIDGITIVGSLASVDTELVIPLAKGWNTISLNVSPGNLSMDSVWAGTGENLLFVKNSRGEVYWPSFAINQLGAWDLTQAYQAYMEEPAELVVTGYRLIASDLRYRLTVGWNLCGFMGPDGLSPEEAFGEILSDIVIVKNNEGEVFWPEHGIDDIGEMRVGEGYWVNVAAPVIFNYPAVSTTPSARPARMRHSVSHFNLPRNTGNNATLLIRPECIHASFCDILTTGDEISVMTASGHCAGAVIYRADGNTALTVWGDDAMTTVVDGIVAGDSYRLCVYDAESGTEFEACAEFSTGNDCYAPNGIVIVESLFAVNGTPLSVDSNAPLTFSLSQNSPNPFNPVTSIPFTLPKESSVTLTIYSITGEKVAELVDGTLGAGSHSVEWDASGVGSGMYFARLRAGEYVETVKMTVVK